MKPLAFSDLVLQESKVEERKEFDSGFWIFCRNQLSPPSPRRMRGGWLDFLFRSQFQT